MSSLCERCEKEYPECNPLVVEGFTFIPTSPEVCSEFVEKKPVGTYKILDAVWKSKEVVLSTTGLTEMEIAVLISSRNNCFGDVMEGGQWSFAVGDDAIGVGVTQYRGVLSSLVKKGLVVISGRKNDEMFALTNKGRVLFSDGEEI